MKTKVIGRLVGLGGLVVVAGVALAACSDAEVGTDLGGGGSAAGGTGGEAASGGRGGTGGTGSGGVDMGGAGGDGPRGGAGGEGGDFGISCAPPTLGEGGASSIDIAGSYAETWGGEVAISDDRFVSGGTYHFSFIDNDERIAIARNDEANDYNPCSWSAFAWTYVAEDLYYCQYVYDADNEGSALAAERPDASDPANSGCSTFPWSLLTESVSTESVDE